MNVIEQNVNMINQITSIEEVENAPEQKEEIKGMMTLTERVDMKALRIIRDNFEEIFNRLGKNIKIQGKDLTYKQVKDYKQAYTVINEFYKAKEKSEQVKYKFSGRITYGRRFHASPSLQECPRPIRHAISKDIYYDLDIKNAHPLFLLQKCYSYGFSHPVLKEYVEGDREGFLKTLFGLKVKKIEEESNGEIRWIDHTISSRDDAKAYFLQILNGGGNGKTGNIELDQFYNRQREFLRFFFNRPEHDKYRLRSINAQKNKKWDNKEGSALNYYLCEIENIVLTHMEHILQNEKVDYGTLCYDGLMIYRDCVKDIATLIKKIQVYISEKMGFQINLSVKDMDEGVDLSGLSIKEDVDMTEEGLAKYMLEALKEDIKYSKKKRTLYKYNEKTALWEEFELDCFKTILSSILIPHIKEDPDDERIGKGIEMIKGNTKQNNIIQQMTPYIKMMNDDLLIDDKFDAGNGLFPIADQMVMDFKTLTIRQRLRSDYFTRTTNRKYNQNYNKEFVEKYYHDVLVKRKDSEEKVDDSTFCEECKTTGKICPSKEYVECLCSTFACIMTGEMNQSMKKFVNLVGEKGDNGKSLFIELHQSILESFSGSVSNRVIVEQKNKSGHDAELFGLVDKWMMSLSETSQNASYDEVRLKQLTGYDAIPLRDAGGNSKSMIEVKFRAVPVAGTNEICKFKTTAFMNRLMCFAFVNIFKVDTTFRTKVISMMDEFFSHLCNYAFQFYKNGRTFPIAKEVQVETNRIKKEQDPILLWLDSQEMFEVENGHISHQDDKENHRITKEKMYESYRLFCDEDEHKSLGKTNFHKMFQQTFKLSTSKVNVKINNAGDKKQIDCYTGFIIKENFNMFEYN